METATFGKSLYASGSNKMYRNHKEIINKL